MRKLFCFLLLLVMTQAYAIEQPLKPDDAFKFKAEAVSPTVVKATWDIADGHYLSREQFKFETDNTDLKLNAPTFPAGETKEDTATQSKHEVYRHKVEIEIPVDRGQSVAQAVQLALKVKYQGCSDAGLCYPPIRKTADLPLIAAANTAPPAATQATAPAAAPAPTATTAATPAPAVTTVTAAVAPETKEANATPPAAGNALPDIFKKPETPKAEEPLPVDQAFTLDIVATDKGSFKANWTVQPNHHLYRPKITFSVKDPQGVVLGKPIFPAGEQVNDEYFGKIEEYGQDFSVIVPITQANNANKLTIVTQYQGCSDATGLCYPLVKKTTELKLAGLPEARPIASAVEAAPAPKKKLNKQDALAQQLEDSSFFQKIVVMFMAGLLLAFTPCIFPMIPILSGIVAGYGNTSSRKAFFLSLTYVLAGAVAYAVIGFVFGFFGQNLQTALQHPIAIGSMSALFVLLAMSMFGFYDLQLPNSLQSRLSEISNRQESGSFVGAAIMGFLSTLIVGPCAGPVIAGALTYIAQSKDAILGGTALFSMGIGIGVPLLLIGTSAGHLLPRAGAWMDTVKAVFGIIMLGIAIFMLSRIVPIEVTMALTGILLVASGVYMGALERPNEDTGGWGRFWKSMGMIQLFYGTLVLLGLAAGSQNLLQPLKGVFSVGIAAQQSNQTGITFKHIKTVEDLDKALAQAKSENRPVMLDFSAAWCTYCVKMEKTTFRSQEVANAFGNTLFLQADVTETDEQDKALMKRFDVPAPPAMIFFSTSGEELRALRTIGEVSSDDLTNQARELLKASK